MTPTNEPSEVTIELLESFLDAWNRHDLDAILEHLEPDCLYITGDGLRLRGHDEIRRGLAGFLTTYPDAHWSDAVHTVAGDRGSSEWVLRATTPDGAPIEMDSCDLFSFRNGRLAVVSAYRRERPD